MSKSRRNFKNNKLCKGKPLNVFTNLGIFPTFLSNLPDILWLRKPFENKFHKRQKGTKWELNELLTQGVLPKTLMFLMALEKLSRKRMQRLVPFWISKSPYKKSKLHTHNLACQRIILCEFNYHPVMLVKFCEKKHIWTSFFSYLRHENRFENTKG